ncbi:MAG: hypothetical protein JF606_29325, partial [Burkholderiales bacterium]|nr:hypothetical protein [Burkholderiales bacterium]
GGVQLGRYTTSEPLPEATASNPLAVVATVSFPRAKVNNVGDALRHLLVRTGYQLVNEEQLDERARSLLALPLPESHRQLGPYRVESMLQVLLGEPWRLQVDSMSRTVCFVPSIGTGLPQATAAVQR